MRMTFYQNKYLQYQSVYRGSSTMAMQQVVGQQAEKDARRYLTQQGLIFISKNYRAPFGEIDLIMREDDALVFVEVRYRRDQRYGGSLESITRAKQQKLIKTAQHYLCYHPTHLAPRFDVIAFTADKIEWIKNAFFTD